jgi:hypothetical protein
LHGEITAGAAAAPLLPLGSSLSLPFAAEEMEDIGGGKRWKSKGAAVFTAVGMMPRERFHLMGFCTFMSTDKHSYYF